MTTVVPRGNGVNRVIVKGAPEILMGMCTHIQTADNTVEDFSLTEKEEV